MKTTEELLYQIRGLARIVVAFSFFYQGLVPKWLTHDEVAYRLVAAHGLTLSQSSWILHITGILEILLAFWLIKAFIAKTPLWVAGVTVTVLLLDTLFVAPSMLGASINALTFTAALLALIGIDILILNFDPAEIKAHQVKQYIRFTRDRMLYEFVKRLELKDLPHLMHTLTQLRLKRRNKNRLKQKTLLKNGEEASSEILSERSRAQDYRRRQRRHSDLTPRSERLSRTESDKRSDER